MCIYTIQMLWIPLLLKTPTTTDSLAHQDSAYFKCSLAFAQQKRPLSSEGGGFNGWQESAEDANGLWSYRAAPARLRPAAIALSPCELRFAGEKKGSNEETGRNRLKLQEEWRRVSKSCSSAVVKAWGRDSVALITTHCVCLTSFTLERFASARADELHWGEATLRRTVSQQVRQVEQKRSGGHTRTEKNLFRNKVMFRPCCKSLWPVTLQDYVTLDEKQQPEDRLWFLILLKFPGWILEMSPGFLMISKSI